MTHATDTPKMHYPDGFITMSLTERIDAAIERITTGQRSMRIPAEQTDGDLVLAECKVTITDLQSRLAAAEAEIAECVVRITNIPDGKTLRGKEAINYLLQELANAHGERIGEGARADAAESALREAGDRRSGMERRIFGLTDARPDGRRQFNRRQGGNRRALPSPSQAAVGAEPIADRAFLSSLRPAVKLWAIQNAQTVQKCRRGDLPAHYLTALMEDETRSQNILDQLDAMIDAPTEPPPAGAKIEGSGHE